MLRTAFHSAVPSPKACLKTADFCFCVMTLQPASATPTAFPALSTALPGRDYFF
jgi:hypothetical protein